MSASRTNLILVGGFVLGGLLTLIVVLAVLAGRAGPTDEYFTEYVNVSGLKFGSQVVFEGYPVGQVERILPVQQGTRTHFRVEMSVARGWKIPQDSVARPVSPGVLSPQIISIVAGKSTQSLAPGSKIKPAGGVDVLSSISSAANNFDELTDTGLLPLLENLNRQVSTLGEILEKDVRPMAQDLRQIVDATADHWPNIARQTDEASAHIAAASARVDAFMSPERIKSVDRLIGNVDQTAQSLRTATEHLETLMQRGGDDLLVGLRDFRVVMTTAARYGEPTAQNLDETMRNFRDFSQQVRSNPGVLLRGGTPPPDPVTPLRPLPEPQ